MPVKSLLAHNYNCNSNPNTISGVVSFNLTANNSYCELCGTGQVTIVITNPTHIDMADFTVVHDLQSSGLEYVPGSTVGGGDPVIAGSTLTWTAAEIPGLALITGPNNHSYNSVDIVFQVRSIPGTEEDLLTANRTVQASTDYTYCPAITSKPGTDATGPVQLPLLEPAPSVTKLGRNVDANQAAGSYSNIIYGNINDDVIWRIQIANNGSADLQDLKFNDLMQNGNFQINYACSTEAEASSIAAADGVGPVGNCVASGNTINDFLVDDPYGNPANDEPAAHVDVPAGGSTFIYLVGKVSSSCVANKINTVSNIEWGCEVIAPDGGISQTSSGASAGSSSSTISTLTANNGLQVVRQLTGININQPVGSRGQMTVTIRNLTGGSVKNIKLRDVLPPEYVIDPTFVPTVAVTPAYGTYDGMVDSITWTNPAAGTFPLVSIDPADPLSNIAPEFDLLSSTVHPDHADQVNMLRHGDRAIVRFQVVMVAPTYFDNNANIDERVETAADTTDPLNSATLVNELYVTFEDFCSPGVLQQPANFPYTDNFPGSPEDLDIDITGTELIFILTSDPTQPLPIQVSLTNNGGHFADNFSAYVTFGATMEVITAPAGCSATSNPPTLEVWEDPADLPATATVYECTSAGIGTINSGQTRLLNFEVIKTSDAAGLAEDDLSLRADVVGEIQLSDGTLHWFPAVNTVPIVNRANNYSLDSVRARVIGFNLAKTQVGTCSEDNPPAALPDSLVQIGEECTYHIDTGGWFGFQTPGFTYIAVQRIQIVDELPDGQAYISSTDPAVSSTASITGISLNPVALAPLDQGWFNWTFNQLVPDERIITKDQWFRVDTTARILNKPIDTSAAPNTHAAASNNILNSTFEAVFNNAITGLDEIFLLGPGTIGYPSEPLRRVDLTISEPNILVTKEVCNESLYGIGAACTNFVTLSDEGDTQDTYVYKVTLANEAISAGVARAPAYNISTTDVLDVSDLMLVESFATDGLDNDADGLIDALDLNGESTINDNVIANATPAMISNSHTHSAALLRLNPGSSISFYYRVDPDDAIAPLQQLNNTVTVNYDTLEGDSGNQSVVLSANSELGGARVINSTPAIASVQILPLINQPKEIIQLSNTTLTGTQPQPVSVGEEIQYQLRSLIPVAYLKEFIIRDELPVGISCIEAPDVDLNAAPYNAAGFSPGGTFTPTCTNNLVEWNFGNQELTAAVDNNLFDFAVQFIARVGNLASVNNGDLISNGSPTTNATLSYRNEINAVVTQNFNQAVIEINEPNIVLTKTFEAASNDAGDVITVTVSATNTGSAAAYNLQVFDDLAAVSNLTFLANVAGTDPPDNIDTSTLGANRPIFSWSAVNPKYEIAVGASISFTFEISVDIGASPDEVLDNTIQASWDSLPGQNTALNLTGLIGANGTATGLRNGSIPNAGDTLNDYETTASTSSTVASLSVSKSDFSPTILPEVGAHKQFEIIIQLTEGTSNNLQVNDNLNNTGLSYILANNAGFDISYSFDGIASINGLAPAESAFTSFPVDNSSGTVLWDIGTVITDSEDDTSGVPAIAPVIKINYFARFNNELATNVGSTLQNSVNVSYTHGEDASTVTVSDTSALSTVTEAVLTVNKTATLISTAPITGGAVIEYQITVTNTGDAAAYDLTIVDTLPAELLLDTGFTPTATIATVAVAGFISTPLNGPAGPLSWGQTNADGNLDIPIGGSLVLTYRALVQADSESNINLVNSVNVDWTSLDGISTFERTGAGCPTTIAPNDYCVGPATDTITIADTSTLIKTVISDSFVPANDASIRIGDTATYQLSLDLQQGTTENVSVQDVLPAGLTFVEIISINGDSVADYTAPASGVGSNFSYNTIVPAQLPTAGQTGTINFILGDVINDPFGDATTDTLSIIYRVRLVENILIQSPTITLNNTATLQYIDGNSVAVVDPARLESTASLTVLQPVMTLPTKIDLGGKVSPANVLVATDVMNFRLSSCNTSGLAPAYNVQITDILATQLEENTIAGPVNGIGQPDVYIGGVLTTSGVDYLYTAPLIRGGSMLFELLTAVDPGQCVDIDYNIGFYTDFGVNQFWDNTASVDEYWSLDAQTGQQYAPLGPVTFTMLNNLPFVPPEKTLLSPAVGEATIGEGVLYQLKLPASNAARYDVVISDSLDASLEYISATEVSGNGYTVINNSVAPGSISLAIDFVPAGQDVIFEVLTRVSNNTDANAGVSFSNTTIYTHADFAGGPLILGGSATTAGSLTIIEPALAINKTVINTSNPGNPPVAGDLLQYSLTFTASGAGAGDNFSKVFDIAIDDQLSLGLVYQTASSNVNGAGNSISDPTITGDGVTLGQNLQWNLSDTTANIDISEGDTVTVTYDVVVLNSVLNNQALTNSAVAQWSSLDGIDINERTGTSTPAVNDYVTAAASTTLTTPDTTSLAKTRLTDTYNAADTNVRVGDLVQYELRIGLQEGQTNAVVLTDTLPQGLAFEKVTQINADTSSPFNAASPFVHNDITAVSIGDPLTGPSTLSLTIGNIVNLADGNAANDDFVISYVARVIDNALAQVNSVALNNNAQLDYVTAAGITNLLSNSSITVLQPDLSVSKTVVTAGGDSIVDANELLTYTVDITNNGAAPAYDLVLQDLMPQGMRNGAATITTISTTLVNAAQTLANIAPVYNLVSGLAVWDFDTVVAGSHSIPAGETLRLVYQTQLDTDAGASLTLTNQAVASLYYSFDDDAVPVLESVNGVREIYGPSNIASMTLTTAAPGALLKENPADLTVAVGETFNYQITVPEVALPIALHDVRIIDDLTASAADLNFVSVTKLIGSQPWSPVNSGTQTNLLIEDTAQGIDIPAGEQIVISVTVQVADSVTNVSGLTFSNTASYTYNQIPNDNASQLSGVADTTANMTIVGPDNLILSKSGPAQMQIDIAETFTLDIQNTGTSPAWDITITDKLPSNAPAVGGMCDIAPSITSAQIFQADGVTPVSLPLVQGIDYSTSFSAEPVCDFVITMQSAAAALAENNRLIITYETKLDVDSADNLSLTNIAATTEWFSTDTNGAGAPAETRTYNRALTNGTTLISDHEDAHTVTSELPKILVQKSVVNISSGLSPGSSAVPGEILRYSILLQNVSNIEASNFNFVDELDALNVTPVFNAGSLNLITIPLGADVSNTDSSGGLQGTGLVDIRKLTLGVAGSANDSLLIEFEVTLAAVITNGTVVLNQGHIQTPAFDYPSDDPNINGADDPLIVGDEDATETLISSAAQFEILKTSTDLTDDPAILLSGDTLRYTITVKNIGDENAVNATITDQLPANTSYVIGSTQLNGVVIADAAGDILPLQDGILINAPENTTAGYMRADATVTSTNVATITFDVLIDQELVNGTLISNQATLNADGAGSPAIAQQLSDDPSTTTVLGDPTRDVVGNQPLIDVIKTVEIIVDNGSLGIVDPGDILRYTIIVNNSGATPATEVVLTDAVPDDTSYIQDSVSLNGLPVAQPDAGVSPLIAGIAISSTDLTPALPTAGNGVLSPDGSAVIIFDVQVSPLVLSGTVISNQGSVDSYELPTELTDADGIDSNGDQPTLVVVGNAQLLTITKEVSVVSGGSALAGGQLQYRIRVTNISSVAAVDVVITDNLDLPIAGQLTYVAGSGLLDGLPAGVSFSAPIITADFAAAYGDLLSGMSTELTFLVDINNSLAIGTTITNTADVYWNALSQTDSASVSVDVGGTPGVGNINGILWHDANFDNVFDATEQVLTDWPIDIFRNAQLLGTVLSDADGLYQINGLIPNDVGSDLYELQFRIPGATSTTASLGRADSPPQYNFTNDLHKISNIVLSSGSNVQNLNLPIDPNGVVYDSILRIPVAGATITLLNAATSSELSSACFDDENQQNQQTVASGYYKFDLNFSQPDCQPGADYLIQITPPAIDYVAQPSNVIPAQTDSSTAAHDVINCPGTVADAIPATATYCEAQPSELLPSIAVAPISSATNYYLHLTLSDTALPNDSQLFNNHLPVDPVLTGAVAISKTSPLVNVTRSQLVPYTITVTNTLPVTLYSSNIIDTMPAGFKYVKNSARLNGVALEPIGTGLTLNWYGIDIAVNQTHTFRLLLIVGAGVTEGEYINRANVFDTLTNGPASGTAEATVRVIPDPAFDCSDAIGKVFEDKNLNGYQDEGENGLSDIKLATDHGLVITSDKHGRFHLTCAMSPDESRGSNFIIKLDERSLPTGYRLTTENPRVIRSTRGKMMKFNFGATIHHTITMDLADDVFIKNKGEIHGLWKPRLDLLMLHLQKAPSVLRLSYLADTESESLVDDRLDKLKEEIQQRWEKQDKYRLIIETDIFWRRGGPPERGRLD